jgi:hypothetical protein
VRFPSKETVNCTLEYSFQHTPGNLHGKSQKINSSQPELNDSWTKVAYKRRRSTQEEAKHAKENYKIKDISQCR